jgi:hypothetical protein
MCMRLKIHMNVGATVMYVYLLRLYNALQLVSDHMHFGL